MSAGPVRKLTRKALTNLPYTAEAYQTWVARNKPPTGGFALDRLAAALPEWVEQAQTALDQQRQQPPKRVLLIGYLSWWLEYAVALGTVLAGLGHRVGLAYLPYRTWRKPNDSWQLRRQSAYLQRALSPAATLLQLHDLTQAGIADLSADLESSLAQLAVADVQYTLQKESLELDSESPDAELHALRLARNRSAAAAVLRLIADHEYQTVVVPNGSILEFGAAFRAARQVGVPVSTYEFGEQRRRVWIAQDAEVMLQDTSRLWEAAGANALNEQQQQDLNALLEARSGGRSWANFARKWQTTGRIGTAPVRDQLGLSADRPLVLLCTNVVGDSLALNRQLFTEGMADWLLATARYFAGSRTAQLVVRVHPGELTGAGLQSAEIVRQALPVLPEHVRLVPADSEINSYDLVELADVGVVYTTTVGLEMAMAGIPVVVAGRTHYANKGFTYDPVSSEQYFDTLDQLLSHPPVSRLTDEQVRLACRYAYRFFFDYPFRFPWHLVSFWEDIERLPPGEVLQPEQREIYLPALNAMLGVPIDWGEKLELEAAGAG